MKYEVLAQAYQELEDTSKRLEKTSIISDFLLLVPDEELACITLLLQGRLFAQWDERKSNMAARQVVKALHTATGARASRIDELYTKTGDLGTAAEELVAAKRQSTLFSSDLEVSKVFSNLQKLAEATGTGSVDRKTQLVSELISRAKPIEAKYIVRSVLEDLRIGVGEGVMRDAIVQAFARSGDDKEQKRAITEAVQEAYDMALDFGQVATILKKEGVQGLSKLHLEPGKPIKSMLFQKADGIEDAFERVGSPAALEYKYDGFRLQIHCKGDKILLFTRRQENVTEQFPDVVNAAKEHIRGSSYIFDAEAVGTDRKSGKYLPFQAISQRIKRKHNIIDMAHRFPVEVNVFDVIYYGNSCLKMPFQERRSIIEKAVAAKQGHLIPSRTLVTGSVEQATQFYKKSLSEGNEGIMAKSLEAVYKPGSRVGFGVKIKPVMKNLDLVIVGAEWGEGKRSGWLTSYTVACRDNGGLLELGRVSTGVKELDEAGTSYQGLTRMLKPLITQEKAKYVRVRPSIVIEVSYEEIQASTKYSSQYALRFPRFIRLRVDRGPDDIDTLDTVEVLYSKQRNR